MKKQEFYKIGRIILFSGYLLGLCLVFLFDAQPQPGAKFDESSLTEYFQESTFFLVVLIIFFNITKRKSTAALSILIGGFFLTAFIREFDAVLDRYVYDGAWQTLVSIVFVLVVFSIYKNHRALRKIIPGFMTSYPFGMMITGMMVTFVYSRLFGETFMWQTVMEENYMRSVKNAAEESIELLGDSLILFSAIEYNVWSKKQEIREDLIESNSPASSFNLH